MSDSRITCARCGVNYPNTPEHIKAHREAHEWEDASNAHKAGCECASCTRARRLAYRRPCSCPEPYACECTPSYDLAGTTLPRRPANVPRTSPPDSIAKRPHMPVTECQANQALAIVIDGEDNTALYVLPWEGAHPTRQDIDDLVELATIEYLRHTNLEGPCEFTYADVADEVGVTIVIRGGTYTHNQPPANDY